MVTIDIAEEQKISGTKNSQHKKINTMNALVFHGAEKKSWEEKPKPTIQQPTDVVVRITKTTICGTDLHIMKGDVPEVTDGRILGHEGVGVIEEVGNAVTNFKKGDRVIISCITSCGKCDYCKRDASRVCKDPFCRQQPLPHSRRQ